MQQQLPRQAFWPGTSKRTANLSIRSVVLALYTYQSLYFGLTGIAAVLLPAPQPGFAAETLRNWLFDPNTNQLEVTLPDGTKPKYSLHSEPTRIVVELPDIEVATDTTQLYPNGLVRSVSLSQSEPRMAKIVMDFAPGIVLTPEQIELQRVGMENRWVLRPLVSETGERSATIATVQPQSVRVPPPPPLSQAPQPNPAPRPAVSSQPAFRPAASTNGNPSPLQTSTIQPVTVSVQVPVTTRSEVSLPPAQTPARVYPVPVAVAAVSPPRLVRFGEPLPPQQPFYPASPTLTRPLPVPPPVTTGYAAPVSVPFQGGVASFILPAGTTLALRYPGNEALPLESKPPRQEVLLLQGGIVDLGGNTVVPANTPVVGRFETTQLGTRFVAQAIYLNGRTIPLSARSDRDAGKPQPSSRSLLRNSGIGGLALFVLGGFSGVGLLAGAALGAATTYGTAPKPATIQPGQLFLVELTEDLSF